MARRPPNHESSSSPYREIPRPTPGRKRMRSPSPVPKTIMRQPRGAVNSHESRPPVPSLAHRMVAALDFGRDHLSTSHGFGTWSSVPGESPLSRGRRLRPDAATIEPSCRLGQIRFPHRSGGACLAFRQSGDCRNSLSRVATAATRIAQENIACGRIRDRPEWLARPRPPLERPDRLHTLRVVGRKRLALLQAKFGWDSLFVIARGFPLTRIVGCV